MRYIGIDVAKDTFEVAFPSSNSKYKVVQFVNNEEGVKKFIKKLKKDDRSVLEATGSYSTRLVKRIMQSGFEVSVVNPLRIKHFSKMNLSRTKTDSSDAVLIAEFGLKMTPEPEKPSPEYMEDLSQRRSVLKQLKETVSRFKNQLHALKSRVRPDLTSIKFIEETIKNLEKQIDELEKNMSEIVKEKASETYKCLKSIPGIGSLSAIELIIVTKNFENFTSYKQLSAYIGLCPRITESGTSV
ncbi:MAG TPA: IS110 family transposase, partial [Leptospiraceae bacterium]|nr:IS110 family transposase [Leptospiraceae bacterium]